MKSNVVVLLLALTFGGAVEAGPNGAGPVGTGSTLVGSIVSTGSMSGAARPGGIKLDRAQVDSAAAYLRSQPGAVVSGSVITAPTTLANDVAGAITLDTVTGELTLTRI